MYLEQCGFDLFSFFIQILGVPSMKLSLKGGKCGKGKVFSSYMFPVLSPNSVSPHPNVTGAHTLEKLFWKSIYSVLFTKL